jgi:RNA polymerase sigma-70 factor, ECF subfamily
LRVIETETDERSLIEAAQLDPSRFDVIYQANFERVYAYIARRVRDRAAAEDLTSEVFHQALANLKRYQWRGLPFAAWLLRIAANAIADRWKATARAPQAASDQIEAAAVEYEVERRALLFQLVESLPADQRLVVVRRFVEQRSIRDIARELGRSEGAVKQLQFRALQTLRAKVRSTHV